MPELPEVETIRRSLDKTIKGKTLKNFWSDWPKKVSPKLPTLKKKIIGEKITKVLRRAKMLIFQLSSGQYLLIHLKMSGQLIYQPKYGKVVFGGHPQPGGLENLPNKFTHYIFSFTDGTKLFFNDLRKFGYVKLINKVELDELITASGVEPFDKEFTLENFKKVLKRYPNRKIKQLLLDQSLISGLGNIYVDESLYAAKIRPTRIVKRIKTAETKRLFDAIKKILTLAIKYKGTSTDLLYVQIDGAPGGFAKYLKVYGRRNENCKRCQTPIKKIKINGRGTHYCPACQK